MYYRLTYRTRTTKYRVGDSLLCGQRPLDIGQTPTCEALLPESEQYEPQVFASIMPLSDNKGWCLVRRTDCFSITVDGVELETSTMLRDGAHIRCSDFGSEAHAEVCFTFNIRNDGGYDRHGEGVVRPGATVRWLTPVLAVVGVVLAVLLLRPLGLRQVNLDRYDASIYHIAVDSVYLVKDTLIEDHWQEVIVEAAALTECPSATCFLTDDGYFVTARHCIEPWIGEESQECVSSHNMPPALLLSAKAETSNRTDTTAHWRVWAHCIVSRDSQHYEYRSTDFHMNKSRDLMLPMGTRSNPLWVRSVVPVWGRRDMELGDFAYVKSPGLQGRLTLADSGFLSRFDRQAGREVAILGYPVKDNDDGDAVTHNFGNSQHVTSDDLGSRQQGCIQMSAHINPGNSGGPVLARVGSSTKVIGIVSKADMHASQGTFWVVPVTEVNRLMQLGDTTIETDIIYRR